MDWGRGNRWPREGGAMRSPRRDGARRGTRGAAPPKLWLRRVGLAVAEESARADTGLARALAAPRRFERFGSELRHHQVLELELLLGRARSEEHTSELQSLMRSTYAAFCLHTKKLNQAIRFTIHRHT